MPEWVACTGYLNDFDFGSVEFSVDFMDPFPKSTLGLQHFTLIEVPPSARNVIPPMAFSGWMTKVGWIGSHVEVCKIN